MSNFLRERADFLRVEIAGDPSAWDVMLRIDGTYFGTEWADPETMAKHFAAWISEELGVEIPVGPPRGRPRSLWTDKP